MAKLSMVQQGETSDELCRRIAEESNGVGVVSLSMGKDSLASALQMAKYFDRLEYVFLYMVPDLEFQNKSLAYYESLLGKRILRFPHPTIYRQLEANMYQPPHHLDAIWDMDLFQATYDDIFSAAKADLGLSEDTWVGVGNRMADSIMRRTSIQRYGADNVKRRQFFPVFDWSTTKVVETITGAGWKLPVDYRIWGRSFDGVDYRFLRPLKDNFPDDYERVRAFFPLVDLELLRYDGKV